VIKASRVYLRPLLVSDASQSYVSWLNDSDVNQYLETRHVVQTVDSCKLFIEQCNKDERAHLYGIFLQGSDKHIGNAKIGFINEQYARGELSLFIGDKAFWGKGFGGEVVQILTRYGFERLMLEKIEAGCYEDNLASLRVFIKIGYTVEGFKRNHVVSKGSRSGCFILGVLKSEFAQNEQ